MTRSYDTAGQLIKQADTDAKGKLLQEQTYSYNVFGEVIEKQVTDPMDTSRLEVVQMEYNAANRLTKYNGQEVQYDAKGNMVYGPVDGTMQHLTYDCRNRLVEAGGISYEYDAENTRTASICGKKRTEYVTDASGSLSRLLLAYEADGTTTSYAYGAEGLTAQYNSGTEQNLLYHYDNIGSTTLLTNLTGTIIERFAYGTYGELLQKAKNAVRFLYNGSYGVVTDENGLYYMRARYYNPDIKRFLNQDIKVGDISNGQGLNRYAYCEGNPVSMVDPFGLSPQISQDQTSRFSVLHNILDLAGLAFDAADVINAAFYAAEGDWTNAALCAVAVIPIAGSAIAGAAKGTKAVVKAKKAEKILELAEESCKMTRNASNRLDVFSDVMKASSKWGNSPVKLMDGIKAETGAKAIKALETGGDFGRESKRAVQELKAVVGAEGIHLKPSVSRKVDVFKDSFVKTEKAVKGGSGTEELIHVYRGTDRYAEISAYKQTGHLMSEATRNIYFETSNLEIAYMQSGAIHDSWLDIWGSEMDYVQAHGAFGTEMSEAFDLERTLMSVTTDPHVACRFAGEFGRVFEAYIPKSQLIKQTLSGAGESEYLIRFGAGGFQ